MFEMCYEFLLYLFSFFIQLISNTLIKYVLYIFIYIIFVFFLNSFEIYTFSKNFLAVYNEYKL